jgi:hypothetical protein
MTTLQLFAAELDMTTVFPLLSVVPLTVKELHVALLPLPPFS